MYMILFRFMSAGDAKSYPTCLPNDKEEPMKKWIGVACLLMCMLFSGCQKISAFFQSPEERLLGHMEDVVEIVANAEHCGKAAKEIQKITQTRMEDVAEDSKAFFRDLVKNHTMTIKWTTSKIGSKQNWRPSRTRPTPTHACLTQRSSPPWQTLPKRTSQP